MRTHEQVLVKAGKYYLGDPCYTVPDHLWMPLLNDSDFFEHRSENTFQGTVEGHTVYAFGTRWGDGVYQGTNGFGYPVDAGLIGLVPIELADNHPVGELVTIIEFDSATLCIYEEGVMQFGSVCIDTDPIEDEEQYFEDEEQYFEDEEQYFEDEEE